ncbi:HDIG domain-containing protein [Serpentinicella sp. ANB-PHB4]|uniref:HD family phosphohydrolase n=1 Tax=Serpentinicella sp. ANB-PHB4 TaxID=3074076 RepID=UPI00286207C1|nr:HDIG domain-containing metalloprotein [Serpentinicella sp. ANB-PHB4]MDR5657984.1 HDIG domain-containing protein [Serpentinicella sp. ANB-PHB4]
MNIRAVFKDKLSNNYITKWLSKAYVKQLLVAMFFFVSVVGILLYNLMPDKYDLDIGQNSPVDIYAPKDIENRWETERLKAEAAESVDLIYTVNLGIHGEVKSDIEEFFNFFIKVQEDEDLEYEEKVELLINENPLGLQGEYFQDIVNVEKERLSYLQDYITEITAQRMNDGIKVEDIDYQKSVINEYISTFDDFDQELKYLAYDIVNTTIRPNQFLDLEITQQYKEEAIQNIDRVMIRKDELVIREGEVITFEKYRLLGELGVLEEDGKIDLMLYLGVMAISIILLLLIIAYIYVFNKSLLERVDLLIMITIIFISTLLIAEAISTISIYLIPLGASAMLLSILIEPRLALLINICLTILIGILIGNDIIFISMAIVGGTAGVFSVLNTQQRSYIIISGLAISIVNIITIIGIGFIYSHEVSKVLTFGMYSFINGILCAILTIGTLPLWENLFNIVTPLKLLELSNPNHPLLKKLLIEAPGTYHHSIIVGNLSESATNALGGNALLARVGSFYHDIGKTKRPYFFKENQLTSENPHDKINPALSSLIITSHVKDGVELAKKYKLPKEIIDFIAQHHGDTLVAYFYHKAKTSEEDIRIEEHRFRYNGPRPNKKETAIVMLADSVEAAVRSLSSHSKEKIETLITKIINEKQEAGQLDESDLTLKEISIIKETFIKVILGIFHERIEYPELDIKELKGKKAYESRN